MMVLRKFLTLAAALTVACPVAASETDAGTSAATPEQPVILTGPDFIESPTGLIDEYYRDLLQYDIHGREHTYRVVVGQSSIEELAALTDVTFDAINRYEGKISYLTLPDTGVSFLADESGNRIVGLEIPAGSIPAIWEVRYGIDAGVLSRPKHRSELEEAGIDWVEEIEASFWNNAREEYAVSQGDKTLVNLSLLSGAEGLSQIRIRLQADDRGNYPRMAAVSKEGRIGGFLRQSFAALGQENRERSISLETTLEASSLTAWTLINRPLGVLPSRVTFAEAQQALERLAQQRGWKPQRGGAARICMTPEAGYDLAFEEVVPEASVLFHGAEGNAPAWVFTFDFHFTRGEYYLESDTDKLLQLSAERVAMKIVNDLRISGYDFTETAGERHGDLHWHHGSRLRSVDIRLRQKSRFRTNDSYEVLVRVMLPLAGKQ